MAELTNDDRADFALKALEAFEGVTRSGRDTSLMDLVADLRHLADRAGWSWEMLLCSADLHYEAEVTEDEAEGPDEAAPEGYWLSEFPYYTANEDDVPQVGNVVEDRASGRVGIVRESRTRSVLVLFDGEDEPVTRYTPQLDVIAKARLEVV